MSESEKDYKPLNADIPPDEIVPLNTDLVEKDRANRATAAVAMRVSGANYSTIAKMLEYPSPVAAREAVERDLASSVGDNDREIMRAISSRRIEKVMRAMMKRATDEEDPEQINAAKVTLMYIDRHIRLYGQDAPQQMTVYTPSGIEMQAWIEEAARNLREATPREAELIDGEIVYADEVDDA